MKVKIGRKGIKVIEDGNESNVQMFDIDEYTEDEFYTKTSPKYKAFWDGIEFGINNFVDADYSMSRNEKNEYMDLNTGKSWNVNLKFLEQAFNLGSDRVALVSGMGIEFNNYFFDNNNNITNADNANRPVNAILSLGTAGKENIGNIISNNAIYDFKEVVLWQY